MKNKKKKKTALIRLTNSSQMVIFSASFYLSEILKFLLILKCLSLSLFMFVHVPSVRNFYLTSVTLSPLRIMKKMFFFSYFSFVYIFFFIRTTENVKNHIIAHGRQFHFILMHICDSAFTI